MRGHLSRFGTSQAMTNAGKAIRLLSNKFEYLWFEIIDGRKRVVVCTVVILTLGVQCLLLIGWIRDKMRLGLREMKYFNDRVYID